VAAATAALNEAKGALLVAQDEERAAASAAAAVQGRSGGLGSQTGLESAQRRHARREQQLAAAATIGDKADAKVEQPLVHDGALVGCGGPLTWLPFWALWWLMVVVVVAVVVVVVSMVVDGGGGG
jgi:hypothetical protein